MNFSVLKLRFGFRSKRRGNDHLIAVDKMRNNRVRFVDFEPRQGDAQNNPIYAENFNTGPQEGGQRNPVDVDDVNQMRNNHIQFVDLEHPRSGTSQNNPIYAENFNAGLHGLLPKSKQSDQRNPVDVDVLQFNHPVPLDEPDDDDIFYRIAVYNSLSDYGVTEVINLDDYYPMGKKYMQAIDTYVNVGESSSSSQKILTVDCSLCFEKVLIAEMFDMIGCSHSYCSDCVRKLITAKLSEGVVKVLCPEVGCKDGFLLPYACRMILPIDVYSMWGDKLCEEMLPEKTKLYCPFKDCSALLINDDEKIAQSECPHCNRLFCAQCKVPWHINFNCKDYQKLGQDERQTEDLLLMKVAKDKKWGRCPRCRFFVERTQGCMYMVCRCGNTFCYGCGSKMDKNYHYCPKCRR
ncbi:E3 ubiquitin-protein ligase RNF31-like isoform X2 [Dioscorea cayenensis subsp. rotundata]|uniref:RBR-type E3 ubiquitin transferase n=1 Tax=Dioscorea cayennensis subsp. rotundata TaxID=55577 RepID=A0AB40CHL8_DIOCR|nr:E3 ubiquitin-protein ligase RNF31-like isoform X2 [Dioscorea cayenensis subsp. rotundata]